MGTEELSDLGKTRAVSLDACNVFLLACRVSCSVLLQVEQLQQSQLQFERKLTGLESSFLEQLAQKDAHLDADGACILRLESSLEVIGAMQC